MRRSELIIPVGERYQQMLYLFKKVDGKLVAESREPTMFVPMTGWAEDERKQKPDPTRPSRVNGGFEQVIDGDRNQPAGWYYVRQAEAAREPNLPEGGSCLRFANAHVGRSAQALQAIGVNGEAVTDLEISYWVRLSNVEAGREVDQRAALFVTFFDADRAPFSLGEIPAGEGTTSWTKRECRLKVPRSARSAVISIGLFGAIGEACFDGLELRGRTEPQLQLSTARKP